MPQILQDLITELSEIEESTEKLKFLLDLAAELPEMPEEEKTPQHKISGCASSAYLLAEYKDGKMYFRGDSDAQIPKGILAFFVLGLEGASPEEVLALKPDIFEEAGLKNILSPSRANGAYQIFQRIQEEAVKINRL